MLAGAPVVVGPAVRSAPAPTRCWRRSCKTWSRCLRLRCRTRTWCSSFRTMAPKSADRFLFLPPKRKYVCRSGGGGGSYYFSGTIQPNAKPDNGSLPKARSIFTERESEAKAEHLLRAVVSLFFPLLLFFFFGGGGG